MSLDYERIKQSEESPQTSGVFKGGVFNGQGILTFTNGEKYIGEFRDG